MLGKLQRLQVVQQMGYRVKPVLRKPFGPVVEVQVVRAAMRQQVVRVARVVHPVEAGVVVVVPTQAMVVSVVRVVEVKLWSSPYSEERNYDVRRRHV